MNAEVDRLIDLRPFLYHLTAGSNLAHVRRLRRLVAAGEILSQAGESSRIRVVRRGPLHVRWNGAEVELRDQDPFFAANVAFDPGHDEGDVLAMLNARVFFWPGGPAGPIEYGVRHFNRYASSKAAVIRVTFGDLLHANSGATPELCAYNSGAPRCSGGRKSPRGAGTFVAAARFPRSPAQVKEVTFVGSVVLPDSTEVAHAPGGPWSQLWRARHTTTSCT